MNDAFATALTAALLWAACPVRAGGPTSGPAPASRAAPRAAHAVVFDFASDPPELGKALADSVRLRLARHEEYFVLDRLSTQELSAPAGISADANALVALMRRRAGCDVGIHGSVQKDGAGLRAQVRCIDLRGGDGWTRPYGDPTERAGAAIARAIVEELTGRPEWTPPQYGEEPEPKDFGRPLNPNGDFEKGHAGWQAPDNVASFVEDGPPGRGKVLRIRTDLARDPWLEYVRRLRFGQADPNRPPAIARDTSYGSVAGLEGVHFVGDWLPAEAGTRYWLTADVAKPGGTPKVFVKGYLDASAQADGLPELSLVELKLTPQAFAALPAGRRKELIVQDAKAHPDRYRRESYRWYLNCRGGNDWAHYAAPFPPRGGLPANVQWLRIQVYAYWPPGTYYLDNVHLYQDPAQKAPLPEEPARTEGLTRHRPATGPATRAGEVP